MEFVNAHGAMIPKLGFGTWQLKGDDCVEGVAHALSIGYRHIDTAQAYGNEEQVGAGMAKSGIPRDHFFLTTKVWHDSMTRDGVLRSTEESLRKLGTDYVDLLLIHWPSQEVPLEETLSAMASLRNGGKTRHVGVSNFPPSLLREATGITEILANQVEYHPYLSQDKLLAICEEQDMMLTAYSPLARGKLLDDDTLKSLGEKYGKSTSQIALRWLTLQEKVSAIPKAASAKHRESNFDIWDFRLSAEEMKKIDALARGERLVDPDWVSDWED